MKVLVCGGRDFGNLQGVERGTALWKKRVRERKFIFTYLDGFAAKHSAHYDAHNSWLPYDIETVHGGATGADRCAADWAAVNWCAAHPYVPDWAQYGAAAGPMRNQKMLDEGKPEMVIAFPGGKGTEDMISRAEAAGVKVITVSAAKT